LSLKMVPTIGSVKQATLLQHFWVSPIFLVIKDKEDT